MHHGRHLGQQSYVNARTPAGLFQAMQRLAKGWFSSSDHFG
jgi:hypothetical protein